jgi:hypothetical protein
MIDPFNSIFNKPLYLSVIILGVYILSSVFGIELPCKALVCGTIVFLLSIFILYILYYSYKEVQDGIESTKNFAKAIRDGTLKKMLARNPHKEGSMCLDGICSMTSDDFLEASKLKMN